VRGSGSDAIRVDGDSARVLRDRVLSSDGYGVYVFGSAAAVERNTLQNTASIAVYLRGNESRAVGNRVTSSYSEGIYAEGTDAVIRSNRVAHTTSTAIGVQGDGALVERNSVFGSDSNGIYVSGDDMRISRNVVSQIVDDSDAFSLSSRTDSGGGSVDRNTAVDCIEYGFYVRTRNVLFTANKAIRVGSENEGGWYVSNDGNTFVNCTASDCDSIGFSISGSGNTLRACRATSNTSCGFRISGNANVLDRCTSLGHPAEGVANNGTETDLLGGTYLGNRQDVSCDSSATWDEWKAPKFKTGGKDEHPLIN
jgi:parallel beta-helix repeat protein